MWASLAIAIISVAASFGAQHVIDKVERIKARSKGMSSDQIIASLMGVVKQAESRYSNFYAKLASKLQAMPNADIVISGKAADAMRKRRKDVETSMNDAAVRLGALEPLQQRVATYATQPESYRLSSAGKKDLADLRRDVESTLKE